MSFEKSDHISTKWIRQKIVDVIIFSNIVSKYYYDQKNKSIQLFVNSWALFRFYRNYSIFSINLSKKFFQQLVESLKIFKKINNFVYKLKISIHWRFHFVFIIAQLKSVFNFKIDFYDCQQVQFLSMHINENINAIKNYVVEKIIKFRQSARGKKYLIKWQDYKSKKNAWKNLFEMNNALNLVQKFEKNRIKKLNIIFEKSNIVFNAFFFFVKIQSIFVLKKSFQKDYHFNFFDFKSQYASRIEKTWSIKKEMKMIKTLSVFLRKIDCYK